jgi:hypothetical protein
MYENRQFAVFLVSELDKINFNEVLETSKDTLRYNTDKTKTFVKWDGETVPTSVQTLTSAEYYTYEEILELLTTPEWTSVQPVYSLPGPSPLKIEPIITTVGGL